MEGKNAGDIHCEKDVDTWCWLVGRSDEGKSQVSLILPFNIGSLPFSSLYPKRGDVDHLLHRAAEGSRWSRRSRKSRRVFDFASFLSVSFHL